MSLNVQKTQYIPINPENLVLKYPLSPLEVELPGWEGGIIIRVCVSGLGFGDYNEKPYSDRETAEKAYARIVECVRNGNYRIEVYEHKPIVYDMKKIKLILTDSELVEGSAPEQTTDL